MVQLTLAKIPTSDNSRDYHSAYTSLYHALQPGHIIALEEAILAYTLGHFEDAEAIFEQRLPPSHTLPILALERSKVYETQGLHWKKVQLFEKALEWNKGPGAEHERRLLLLFQSHAKALVHGTLRDALEEARKMPAFLADLPLEKYTDINVSLTSRQDGAVSQN